MPNAERCCSLLAVTLWESEKPSSFALPTPSACVIGLFNKLRTLQKEGGFGTIGRIAPPGGRTRPQLNSPLPATPKPLKCFLLLRRRRHASPTRNAEEGERKEHKKGSVSRKNTLRRCFSPPLALCAALCLLSSAVNQLMLRRRALSFRGRR